MKKQSFDTVVIGSGPGGYVAAIRAAQLGQKVAVVEKGNIGGICLNEGCIPSKALIHAGHQYQSAQYSELFGVKSKEVTLDFQQTQRWKDQKVVKTLTTGVSLLLKKNGVKILQGTATFETKKSLIVAQKEQTLQLNFSNAIIATGSSPFEIQGFTFGKRILDSTAALNLKEVPKKLVVIGGGYIGSELAGAYANLGSEVTIIEGAQAILPSFDADMVDLVVQNFKRKKVKIVTNAVAKQGIESDNQIKVTYAVQGKEEVIEADYVMVTVGRKPNTADLNLTNIGIKIEKNGLLSVDKKGRTSQPHIYAIGDIVPGLALAHKASYEGKVAAENIAGQFAENDYIGIPAVCFTDPELATVGLTEKEAFAKNIKVKTSTFPFVGNGRALSLNQNAGFVRLITRKEDNVLVGAQVAGVGASDIIAELTLGIESNLTAEDIALTIHAHPTLAETFMDAAELALGTPIHL